MLRVRDVADKERHILRLLFSSLNGDQSVSYTIFVISPTHKDRRLFRCEFGAVSPWALDLFLKEYETRRADAVADFCRYISRSSDTKESLWAHVFERQVLNSLDGIDAEHKFLIRGLTSSDSEQRTWTYRGPIRRFTFLQDSDLIDEMIEAVQNKEPVHLVPSVSNFAAVDSILYDPNEVLTCIKTAIRGEHHILVSGLRRLQSWLKRDTRLAGLGASKERPWRLIFVVPSDEGTFELRRLEGDTAEGEWAGQVRQYVLGLDVLGKKPK